VLVPFAELRRLERVDTMEGGGKSGVPEERLGVVSRRGMDEGSVVQSEEKKTLVVSRR
jgi:hypothetical protein